VDCGSFQKEDLQRSDSQASRSKMPSCNRACYQNVERDIPIDRSPEATGAPDSLLPLSYKWQNDGALGIPQIRNVVWHRRNRVTEATHEHPCAKNAQQGKRWVS
jgi:hypothetical protein